MLERLHFVLGGCVGEGTLWVLLLLLLLLLLLFLPSVVKIPRV